MIFFHIILHSAVHRYDFNTFITSSSSFHRFITNQFNDMLSVGLLASLVECCTGIAEVKGSNPIQAWIFFRLSFCNCKSCVYNCYDLLSYKASLRSSHIWFSYNHNFIMNDLSLLIFNEIFPFFQDSNSNLENVKSGKYSICKKCK